MAHVARYGPTNSTSYHVPISNSSAFLPIWDTPTAPFRIHKPTSYQSSINRQDNYPITSRLKSKDFYGNDDSSDLRNYCKQTKNLGRYSTKTLGWTTHFENGTNRSPNHFKQSMAESLVQLKMEPSRHSTRKTSLSDYSDERRLDRKYLRDVSEPSSPSDYITRHTLSNIVRTSERKPQSTISNLRSYPIYSSHILEKPAIQRKCCYVPQKFKDISNSHSRFIKQNEKFFPHSYLFSDAPTKPIISQVNKSISEIRNDECTDIDEPELVHGRYKLMQQLGKGSFGEVFKALDHFTGQYCAIKMVKDVQNFKQLAEHEIEILTFLTKIDKCNDNNFIQLNDHFLYRGNICMVFDLLSTNLYQIIHRNNYHGFPPYLVKKFTKCILKCLSLMHSNNVIHCDLKPENILLVRPGFTNLKVIDFGSSCYVGQTVYSYIQSRFYRAPEVILRNEYDTAIDIWSLGCIIVELLTGTPLFPGENEQDQMACIMEVLGIPPASISRKSTKSRYFFTDNGEPLYLFDCKNSKDVQGSPKGRRMNRAMPGTLSLKLLLINSMGSVDADLLDFLESCLRWMPFQRISAMEALEHPWISSREEKQQWKLSTSSSSNSRSTSCDEGEEEE